MTADNFEPRYLRSSVVGALLSNVTPQFRRVTFGVSGTTIELRFLFAPPDDHELRELAEEIASLVVANFTHAMISTDIEFSDRAIPASATPDHAFLRRERGMFRDVPEPTIMFDAGGSH